jgi:hypothetical protein
MSSQINMMWNKVPYHHTNVFDVFEFFRFFLLDHGIINSIFSWHIMTTLHAVIFFFNKKN